MTKMFGRLLRGGKSAAEQAEPRLTLAAFGKHPGWDDYLGSGVDTGIGVATETLLHVKHAVHTDGIRGQIDRGAWEMLEPGKRLEGFDHTFLWLRGGHVILGQIWASTDGKRRRYPMVACIDSEGVTAGFVLAKARPELKRFSVACQATTMAEQVTAEHCAAQDRLQNVLNESEDEDVESFLPIQAKRRFLAHPALGPERLGLLRALHELETMRGVISRGGKTAPHAGASVRNCHLRLPLASDLRHEALALWAAFLRCAIPEASPLLLLSRSGVEWIDVIVGEPTSDDFFWLQAALQASPLTTEIPFEIAPELKPRLEQLEALFLGGEPGPPLVSKPAAPPSPEPSHQPATPPAKPFAQTAATAASPSKPITLASPPIEKTATPSPGGVSAAPLAPEPTAGKSKTGLIVGGAVLLLLAGAALLWFGRGWLAGPADLTVTAESRTRTYGEANPPLTGAMSGLRQGDAITVTYSTTADIRSPVGRYDIIPVLRDPKGKLASYRVITNNGTLTITPATLTVSANNQSRPYGSVNPPLTGAIQGVRNADGIAFTFHTSADPTSAIGTYDIVPAPSGQTNKLSNYVVTTRNGTLTVTAVPLTVVANNQRRAYGMANPPLTATVAGLRKEDGITVICRTKADEKSPVGNYDIEPEINDSAKKLGNYAATISKAVLTVTPVALTVTPNNQRRAFGITNPPLTGWITPNTDEITAAYTTEANATSPAGDYRTTPVLSDPRHKLGNYTVTTNTGWLTVSPPVVTSAVPANVSTGVPGTFTNSIGMEFVLRPAVPPDGAYVGKCEVSQKQYQSIMGRLPTFQPADGDDLPVANVAFGDAQDFCKSLSAREHRTYALPTREEWLAAAQINESQVANAWNVLAGRGRLEHEVTSSVEVRKVPDPVGSHGAQTNGLCDLLGNLREWVVGPTGEERAGFSYRSPRGHTKDLFLPASATDPLVAQETGFRCILRK